MRTATPAERERLNATFDALCRIPSPFGSEQACVDYVTEALSRAGLEGERDQAGNVLYRLGEGEGGVLLCAHLDTVVPQAELDPVVVDDGWENRNEGILGADNKAAVAMLLEVAARDQPPPLPVELLFTVREECGLEGAKAFDAGRLRSRFGYVFDHATPIGEIVLASPTAYRLEAEFRGAAAHAGIRPEDGRNAIVAAAKAVAAMPMGRIDAETTANVGRVEGGSISTNVVADRCRIEAECRSLDHRRADTLIADLVDHVHDGANAAECDVDVIVNRVYEGYRKRPSDHVVQVAEEALRTCGYQPVHIASGGASDANALEAAGFRCVNLANGTERAHETTERVSLLALEGMLDVTYSLLDACARC
ncbi:MAG TPA: M20/M25/M40 family metallo-hydrolase [Solirubrobacteraceae bacterium]|nr:M20/M25/M40 family metallo-hydrolase [Solirubrobacteraceae bacterium]